MLGKRTFGELIRFGVTGGFCVVLNVGIVMVLTEYAHLHYLVSLGICFMLVTTIGFLFNRYWTFRKQGGGAAEDYARYFMVATVNLVVSVALCGLLVDGLGIRYPVAMVILSVMFVPLTFVLHRVWTFRLSWRNGESR